MKKLFTILIACLLACSMLLTFTACSGGEPPRVASKGLKYELNDEETGYIVIGRGSCGDKNIVIPENYNNKPVVTIGEKAFYNDLNLTGVDIPDSVIEIGAEAFRACTIITSISLGSGVRAIGYRAFSSCDSLESIVIPISVETMEGLVFTDAGKLKDIYYAGASTPSGWDANWKYVCPAVVHYNYGK